MSRTKSLTAVIGEWFGMDQNLEQFRGFLFEADFERRRDVMDAGERQIVGHGAVAGHIDFVAHAFDLHVMQVEDFRKFTHYGPQLLLQHRVALHAAAGLDGGRLAFNVGEYGGDFRNLTAHLGLNLRDLIVGLLEAESFGEFEVLFHMKTSGEILDADVMHAEVVARSHGADAVKDVFPGGFTRHGADDHVTFRKKALHGLGNLGGHLIGPLEGDIAGQSYGEIGKITIAGAANAGALHFNDAGNFERGIDDARAVSSGSRVKKRVNGLAGQTPAHVNNDHGNQQRGYGVGIHQPGIAVAMVDPDRSEEHTSELQSQSNL